MRTRYALLYLAAIPSLGLLGCSDSGIVDDAPIRSVQESAGKTNQPKSCWGQASAAFAQFGAMGEHSSQQSNPRLGLANLARELYEAGVIAEPTMSALGTFFAAELGLSIDACSG